MGLSKTWRRLPTVASVVLLASLLVPVPLSYGQPPFVPAESGVSAEPGFLSALVNFFHALVESCSDGAGTEVRPVDADPTVLTDSVEDETSDSDRGPDMDPNG